MAKRKRTGGHVCGRTVRVITPIHPTGLSSACACPPRSIVNDALVRSCPFLPFMAISSAVPALSASKKSPLAARPKVPNPFLLEALGKTQGTVHEYFFCLISLCPGQTQQSVRMCPLPTAEGEVLQRISVFGLYQVARRMCLS
jgi:hypothetical protein